jgi:DNA helicase-2/ATP-dependent DNA helicase PcrA
MTALRAKGKEFDKVVLLDVQGGIWPNKNARTPNELESERRVFYVGFTRARGQVSMLTHKASGVSPYVAELGFDVEADIRNLDSTAINKPENTD